MENENSKQQFDLANSFNHQTYVAKYGRHGSSMLVEERVGNDVEETWNVSKCAQLEEVQRQWKRPKARCGGQGREVGGLEGSGLPPPAP